VRKLLQKMGIGMFFLAWPAFLIYLRRAERTRIIVEHDGKILVTKNWISDNKWSLPGGGLHKDEPIVRGAIRELSEETGIVASSRQLRFVAEQQYNGYGLRYQYHIFILKLSELPDVRRQRHEVSEVAWINPHELTTRNAAVDTLVACKALLSMPRT